MCSCFKFKFHHLSFAAILFVVLIDIRAISGDKHNPNSVRINKCCEKFEILVDGVCTHVNKTNTGLYWIYFDFDVCCANRINRSKYSPQIKTNISFHLCA